MFKMFKDKGTLVWKKVKVIYRNIDLRKRYTLTMFDFQISEHNKERETMVSSVAASKCEY